MEATITNLINFLKIHYRSARQDKDKTPEQAVSEALAAAGEEFGQPDRQPDSETPTVTE